jgi:hypothetical protein
MSPPASFTDNGAPNSVLSSTLLTGGLVLSRDKLLKGGGFVQLEAGRQPDPCKNLLGWYLPGKGEPGSRLSNGFFPSLFQVPSLLLV